MADADNPNGSLAPAQARNAPDGQPLHQPIYRPTNSRPPAGNGAVVASASAIAVVEFSALSSRGVSDSYALESIFSNLAIYGATWLMALSPLFLLELYRQRPASPLRFGAGYYFGATQRDALRTGWPALLAIAVFMSVFSAMKSAIPLFNPYSWDATLIGVDRAIHGTDPWRLLQPVLGYPIVTSAISLFYHLWILLLYGGVLWFAAYERNARLRLRYLLTFIGSWTIIGVVLAIAFSSVGPCFVQPILGDPHFQPQMDYLREANRHFPVMVLAVQDTLLAWYRLHNYGLGSGITAMPSMHVSLACLTWLTLRRIDRRLGYAALAFLLIIVIGSVHLAYHYAVDGYIAIAVTWAIWWGAGRLTDRLLPYEPAATA